jgi:hypothetical protein
VTRSSPAYAWKNLSRIRPNHGASGIHLQFAPVALVQQGVLSYKLTVEEQQMR